MKILVMNGSPKKKSDTMCITNAFLEGLNIDNNCDIKVIDVIQKDIKPCLGCFSCWRNLDGKCIQKDDQNEILDEIQKADILIWSFPLYYYGLPSHLKAVVDRTIPFARINMRYVDGKVVHENSVDLSHQRYIIISGAGFPHFEDNFTPLKQWCHNVYGDHYTSLFLSETPLLNVKELKEIVDPLLAKIRKAGVEYIKTGMISEKAKEEIETPLVPRDMYISMINQIG